MRVKINKKNSVFISKYRLAKSLNLNFMFCFFNVVKLGYNWLQATSQSLTHRLPCYVDFTDCVPPPLVISDIQANRKTTLEAQCISCLFKSKIKTISLVPDNVTKVNPPPSSQHFETGQLSIVLS